MDYQLLIVLHLLGLAALAYGFGVLFTTSAAAIDHQKKYRIPGIIAHGIGLVLLIATGLTMLTQLKGAPHGWLAVKLIIWIILGGLIVLVRKKPNLRSALLAFVFILIALAAYLGRTKPF